jgi:hypothetical protein
MKIISSKSPERDVLWEWYGEMGWNRTAAPPEG